MADTPDPSNTPPAASAVALGYDRGQHSVPKILAKGRGELAKQILDMAFEKGIKVREDADLVQLLEQFETESEIPVEAFAAVAEILNYIYQLNNTPNALKSDFNPLDLEKDRPDD